MLSEELKLFSIDRRIKRNVCGDYTLSMWKCCTFLHCCRIQFFFDSLNFKCENLVTRFLCHFLSLPQTSWSGIPGWWLREYRILRTRKFPTMSRFHQASCGFFPNFSDTNPCWCCTIFVPRLSGVQLQAIQKQKQCSFSNQPHQIPKRWHQYRTSPEIYETEIVYDKVECAQSKNAIALL